MRDVPDPEEGDIDRVEWEGPNGMRFSRISYRRSTPHINRPRGPPTGSPADPVAGLLSFFLGNVGHPPTTTSPQMHNRSNRERRSSFQSPLQHSLNPSSGSYTTRIRMTTSGDTDPSGTSPQGTPGDDLHGILTNLLTGLHGHMANDPNAPNPSIVSPIHLFHQLLNPANALRGDAVYTQEALDRVISQLMEQHSTSTAPGPASAAAIAALPKIKLDKSKLDKDGKAECSICMESLEVGIEVLELPCKHWFHGECVSAWLREHDVCPLCRRGIMPKEGSGEQPRVPGQVPMNMQDQWAQISPSLSRRTTAHGDPERGGSIRANPPVPSSYFRAPSADARSNRTRSDHNHGNRSSASGGDGSGGNAAGGGGLGGWFARRFGGDGNGSGR